MPLVKDLDSNDDASVDTLELPPEMSPENSITSINSISSLLKEKLMVSNHTVNIIFV